MEKKHKTNENKKSLVFELYKMGKNNNYNNSNNNNNNMISHSVLHRFEPATAWSTF
uniref:Uncharacterized protein n=1 Tax=Octopus bimaculoides TaxID=37653 RepID=A0A0L8IA95_OCTBM